jgi:predicted ester cyclase
MSIEANKELVQRFHTELWSGNLDVVDKLLSLGYTSNMGDAAAIKTFMAGVGEIITELTFKIEELIAEGDKVVMRWQISGVNSGPAQLPDGSPLPPPGQPFTYTGITINGVQEGKIVSDVYENSWLAMLMEKGRLVAAP